MSEDFTNYYKLLHNDITIPIDHIKYLNTINYYPKVVFDIGAAVLHWTKEAKKIWPNAKYYAFEGMTQVKKFYEYMQQDHTIGLLSDIVDKEVVYNCNPINLGGNSYYKENEEYSSAAKKIYTKEFEEVRTTTTLDYIVKTYKYPQPDFIKIDVQGAEIDVLIGAEDTLKGVNHLIIELQHVQYNIGAKLVEESLPFIESLGFQLVPTGNDNKYFCGNGPDADYHFIKK
jgi:FkbM family methyltransferase